MKFIHRLGYYLGGFSVGLILLAFFLSGKKTSCSYGPDARVLKNIGLKQLEHSSNSMAVINSKVIDTATVSYVLMHGDVNFSKSNTKLDSCKIYVIEDNYDDRNIVLTIENCDSIATIQSITIN